MKFVCLPGTLRPTRLAAAGLLLVLSASTIPESIAEGALPLPKVVPFAAAEQTARQDPVFTVNSFSSRTNGGETSLYEQPAFTVGNKAVFLRRLEGRNFADRPECISIYIDNKEVGRIAFWGSYSGVSGYPFNELPDDPERLVVDQAAKTVTFQRPYLAPDGSRATFEFRLSSLGDSRIEVTWDVGEGMDASGERLGISLWLSMDSIYRDNPIYFGDVKVPVASMAELAEEKVTAEVKGDLHFAPNNASGSYSVLFDGMTGQVTQSHIKADRYGWIFRGRSAPTGRVVIDLEEGALPGIGKPAPISGFDMWAIDGIHIPASPVRNLMPNPSFEQGLRYWNWTHGGALYNPAEGVHNQVTEGGLFGEHALKLRDEQSSASGLRSFPMPLEKGQTYTFSFYAKADQDCELSVALASAAKGGQFKGRYGHVFGDNESPDSKFEITPEWQRYSRTFTADGAGFMVILSGRRNTLIDGLQLEKGATPTEFVTAPIDGVLVTNDPDNSIAKGEAIEAAFRLAGKPGTKAGLTVSVKNAYRETLFDQSLDVEIPETGVLTLPIKLDEATVGEGVFVVRADYEVPGCDPYTDYYRFSVIDPLSNTHATKDVFGTLTNHMKTLERGDDLGRRFMEWGFGSSSWVFSADESSFGVLAPLEEKYRISNYWSSALPSRGKDTEELRQFKHWTEVTPELEAALEEAAYQKVKQFDPERYDTWHMGNEEESSPLVRGGRFDEYFKAQLATARGVKRANPNAMYAPTNGTSGYNRLRGYEPMEGYLKAAKDHGFKYDAIAVHPYGSADKGTLADNDLDEETQRLIDQMARYGYGEETPIFYTEMFNKPETYFPAWGAGPAYDDYQAGKLGYDFGNREFIQAATAARVWLIVLKYWPHVRTTNMWVNRPFLDYYLTPTQFAKAANTLGHHFPDVEFVGDIKPAAGVRGYSFKRKDGTGVAAMWCIDHDVENGLTEGPVIDVTFDQPVEFFDFMGNPRSASPDASGMISIPLTPAPLIIEAGNVEALTKSLQSGEVNDAKSALAISMEPDLNGDIYASIRNQTGRGQSGTLEIAGEELPYALSGEQTERLLVKKAGEPVEFGKMYRWSDAFSVTTARGDTLNQVWNMDYFYVPKTDGMPNWDEIPAIEITNRVALKADPKTLAEDDLRARYRMAWDAENLYLRIEVEDDHFVTSPEIWKQAKSEDHLWLHDGALEVYFDTGADGRTNAEKTFDDDDYRYDFAIAKNLKPGQSTINRYRAVYHQLADGIDMPTREEAAEKVISDFQITDEGYNYTITFGQRYIEPLALEKGFLSGFALYLHDKDDGSLESCSEGLSLATEAGAACDFRPEIWPLMILSE